MRKQKKQEIMDIVMLLGQAHQELEKQLKQAHSPQVMELLADCQNAVIAVGNQIEQTEGENTAVIPILEQYCETAYRIYEQAECSIGLEQIPDCGKLFGELESLLKQITESIEHDIPVKKEVVFLPYKASMWDSLESVWKAAEEDSECDAYVVPIPYFDRNADGTLGKMHYEGELYPKEVRITDYRSYDIEKRRPDMIFIHNPYDERNLVTSVHPNFYAGKLKECTEELVYIPYFILPEISPDNVQEVKSVAHFCTAPAVIHAHKVIVQSEQMKAVYVKVLTECFGEHTRFYWEEKILGLGSPKLDKVAHTKKEDVEVPQEWRRLLEKPKGGRKRVVLYNTSVANMLQHSDTYLRKMKDVLNVFREVKEETVLLWRPHPLMYATIKSMRPSMEKEYLELLEQYRREGWGILDETADVDRAIALADAYYGDSSSVVQLCQKVGIPVMIQNVNIMYGEQACLVNV